jgi:L-lactate dehydrogenase complex protein LldF
VSEAAQRPMPTSFRERAEEALRDTGLRAKMAHAMGQAREARARRVAEIEDFEARRERASELRRHVIESLGDYVRQLIRACQERGITVFLARDGRAARRYVTELALERGYRYIAKSKTMVGEEIGLVPAMEEAGLNVVETDLGEFIVQLAGEMPSHITSPAVHCSKEDVGRLFAERLGVPYTDDIVGLTGIAREHLRRDFLRAEMGITGANFLVAETGTAVIIENEGNARLVTSLPRTHVIVAGIERILPRMSDVGFMVPMLVASAVGQRLSGYTSLVTGPRRPGEVGGPEEVHLVLVDGGRTNLLAQPDLRDALMCIRCGACLNACPVYERVGGHAYGWCYQGPIGKLLAPDLWGVDHGWDLAFASSLCGACGDVCPVKIDIPKLLLRLRELAVAEGRSSAGERRAVGLWRLAMEHPKLYHSWVSRASRTLLRRMPKLAARMAPGWAGTRELPEAKPQTFAEIWQRTGGLRR